MDDAKRLSEIYDSLKHRAAKKASAESLDFLNLDTVVRATPAIIAIFGVAIVSVIVIFILVGRSSAQQRFRKVRKTFFVPQGWLSLACGLCAWQNLHAFTTVLVFLKTFSTSVDAETATKLVFDDYYTWALYGVNTFWVILFAITMSFSIDLGYAVLAALFSIGTTFLQAASMSESLAIAGYLGLFNVLFAVYWGVGIGKGWVKNEMQQAMREIEGWGVPKEMTAALSSAASSKRRSAVPRRPPTKK